jgi:hypothetical protein
MVFISLIPGAGLQLNVKEIPVSVVIDINDSSPIHLSGRIIILCTAFYVHFLRKKMFKASNILLLIS